MKKRYQKILSLFLTFALIFSTLVGAGKNNVKASELGKDKMKALLAQKMDKQLASGIKNEKLSKALKADKANLEENGGKSSGKYNPDEKIRVVVQLRDTAAVEDKAKDLLPTKSGDFSAISKAINDVKSTQLTVKQKVEEITGETVRRSYGYLLNGFSITAKRSDIPKIQAINGVKSVTEAKTYYPDMTFAKNLTQTFEAWSDLGYKGEGMVVSIIDTGIDYTHKDLQAVPVSPKLNDTTPDGPGKYYTPKVPYGYNFADGNDDVIDRNPNTEMHGMHVAGIVAANGNDSDIDSYKAIKGVAPEAQLLAMKVFSNNPGGAGAYDDDVIAAIEDSVLHGADVINMSLGSTAGFQDENDPEQQAVKNAVDQGVVVVISAGNSAISTTDNGWNIPQTNWFGTVDTATVGSPGTTRDALTVASYENSNLIVPVFNYTATGTNGSIYYMAAGQDPVDKLNTNNSVVDCGIGAPVDFDNKDVNGKIALIKRGTYSFVEKIVNAQSKGAVGVIIYNQSVAERPSGGGDDPIGMAIDETVTIPAVSVGNADGVKLANLISSDVQVVFTGELGSKTNQDANDISPYTSWGPTPSLDFKPEIMAPGGDIYSLANGNKYQTMSGTSMAAPHTSGSEALIVEAAKKNLGLTGRDLVEYAKNTTINTAKVEMDKRHSAVPYSPRRQGAGMVQIKDAINNNITVTDNTGDAAVALKQIGKTTTFTLNLKNFGSTDLTFNPVKDFVLSETMDNTTAEPYEVSIAGASMTFDKNTVTIPAKGQAQVTVTLTLPDTFAKQQFVEGYIKINSADTAKNPSLEVPFIGFYGDWSAMDSIDKPVWDQNSIMSAFGFSIYDGGTGLGTINPFTGGFIPYGATVAGDTEIVDPENIAMSNAYENTIKPVVIPNLYFLRNVKDFKAELLDGNKNKLTTLDVESNVRKDVFEDNLTSKPSLGTLKLGAAWLGQIYDASTGSYKNAEQGQYYIRVTTKSDIDGALEQTLDMPVKLDSTAPTLDITSSDTSAGAQYLLNWTASDDYSGMDNSILLIAVNGNIISDNEYSTLSESGSEYSISLNLHPGNNIIEMITVDNAGNIAYDTTNVNAGSESAVYFDNFSNGMKVNADMVKDNNYTISGVVRNDVKTLEINNEPVTINDDLTFSASIQLLEGPNTISVVALDQNSTELINNNIIIDCDLTSPIINLTSPQVDEQGYYYTDSNTVTISGNVSDTKLDSVYINGEPVTVQTNGDFSQDFDVPENTQFDIYAEDAYGNYSADHFTVVPTVNTTPFKVNFDNLYSFNVITEMDAPNDTYTITGTVNHSTSVFKINDTDVTINNDLTFEVPVKLTQGNNIVKVYAEDAGRVVYNYSYKVLFDSEAPELTISQPVANGDGKVYTNQDKLTIKGQISDNTYGYMLLINGNMMLNVDRYPTTGNDGNKKDFSYDVNVANGDKVSIQLIDEFGNVAEDVLDVVVDKTAPKAPVITPSTTQPTNQDIDVTIASDPSDADISKVEYSFDHNTWLTYTEPFKVVANTTVYVRTIDFAGNTNESNLAISNIDKTAPVISIAAPAEGGTYIKVTPDVSVNEGTYTMKLDDKAYTGGEITTEGNHVLVVSAVDPAGNTSSKTVNFIIDKTAPVVSISGVEDGKEYNNKVAAEITSNEGKLTVTLDGNAYNGDDITSLGTHSLIAAAVDNAGNSTTITVRFTIKPVLGNDVPVDLVAAAIGNSKEKQINVGLENTTTVDNSIFKAVAGQDKNVSFTVNSNNTTLTWTFNAKEINANNIKDVDLSLNAQAPNKDTITKIDSNAQILSFKDNGVLPAPATIRIKLDSSKMDLTKPVYFYYYNPITKNTELIAGPLTPDKDGYVEVTIKHCSDYFFSNNDSQKTASAVANLPKTGSMFDMNVLVALGILLTAIGTLFVARRRRIE